MNNKIELSIMFKHNFQEGCFDTVYWVEVNGNKLSGLHLMRTVWKDSRDFYIASDTRQDCNGVFAEGQLTLKQAKQWLQNRIS